jgi:hypothetical protein
MKKRIKRMYGRKMLAEYDFSSGVRGKYAKRYRKGSNIVVLDSDVAKVFHDDQSVNHALRVLASVISRQKKSA